MPMQHTVTNDRRSIRRPQMALGILPTLLTLMAGSVTAQVVSIDLRTRHASYVTGEPVMVRLAVEGHGVQPVGISGHKLVRSSRI